MLVFLRQQIIIKGLHAPRKIFPVHNFGRLVINFLISGQSIFNILLYLALGRLSHQIELDVIQSNYVSRFIDRVDRFQLKLLGILIR